MNDDDRLELERYFDGELPINQHARVIRVLADDHEAQAHLNQLTKLRALARCHDLAKSQRSHPVSIPRSSRERQVRASVFATAALAASLVAIVGWRVSITPVQSTVRRSFVVNTLTPVPPGRSGIIQSREVALYTWANTMERRPEPIATALLSGQMRTRKRSTGVEILALDLANSSAERAARLEPLALLRKATPGGRSRSERNGRHVASGSPGA